VYQGKHILGRGRSKCKGPETGENLGGLEEQEDAWWNWRILNKKER
jgi:hypothetical protein